MQELMLYPVTDNTFWICIVTHCATQSYCIAVMCSYISGEKHRLWIWLYNNYLFLLPDMVKIYINFEKYVSCC